MATGQRLCGVQSQTVGRGDLPSAGTVPSLAPRRGRRLTGTERLHHHVRPGAQASQHRHSPRPLQVHHQRTLASGQPARVAAAAGSVHTHHLRPEVRQDHAAEGNRGQAGEFNDCDAPKRHVPASPRQTEQAAAARTSASAALRQPQAHAPALAAPPPSACAQPQSLQNSASLGRLRIWPAKWAEEA